MQSSSDIQFSKYYYSLLVVLVFSLSGEVCNASEDFGAGSQGFSTDSNGSASASYEADVNSRPDSYSNETTGVSSVDTANGRTSSGSTSPSSGGGGYSTGGGDDGYQGDRGGSLSFGPSVPTYGTGYDPLSFGSTITTPNKSLKNTSGTRFTETEANFGSVIDPSKGMNTGSTGGGEYVQSGGISVSFGTPANSGNTFGYSFSPSADLDSQNSFVGVWDGYNPVGGEFENELGDYQKHLDAIDATLKDLDETGTPQPGDDPEISPTAGPDDGSRPSQDSDYVKTKRALDFDSAYYRNLAAIQAAAPTHTGLPSGPVEAVMKYTKGYNQMTDDDWAWTNHLDNKVKDGSISVLSPGRVTLESDSAITTEHQRFAARNTINIVASDPAWDDLMGEENAPGHGMAVVLPGTDVVVTVTRGVQGAVGTTLDYEDGYVTLRHELSHAAQYGMIRVENNLKATGKAVPAEVAKAAAVSRALLEENNPMMIPSKKITDASTNPIYEDRKSYTRLMTEFIAHTVEEEDGNTGFYADRLSKEYPEYTKNQMQQMIDEIKENETYKEVFNDIENGAKKLAEMGY